MCIQIKYKSAYFTLDKSFKLNISGRKMDNLVRFFLFSTKWSTLYHPQGNLHFCGHCMACRQEVASKMYAQREKCRCVQALADSSVVGLD